MKLYKYTKFNEFTEDLIVSGSLFLASPSQLNDPFECSPWLTFGTSDHHSIQRMATTILRRRPQTPFATALDEATAVVRTPGWRAKAEAELRVSVVAALRSDVGIGCFSEIPSSILMWSHYAEGHSGLCLEFEASDDTPLFGTAQKVGYSEEYPCVDYFETANDLQVDLIFLTKAKEWHYEKEWRIVDHDNGPGLCRYPSELLTRVIFGLNTRPERRDAVKDWIAKRSAPVILAEAIRNAKSFDLSISDLTPS